MSDCHESNEHPSLAPRNRRWLRWIAGGSMAIGLAEMVVGGPALRVDGAHNVAGDPASYLLKDSASTHFSDVSPRQVRRRLRVAGYILCLSSLFGVAEATHDIATDSPHEATEVEMGLAAVSVAYGAFAARKLHQHNHDHAHRHGFRHAASDMASSAVVLTAAVASHHGLPVADAAGAVAAAAITVGFNYPLESRLPVD